MLLLIQGVSKVLELNIETISIVIACVSVVVGVASVVDKNRREIKTREANLFMQINQYLNNPKYVQNWNEVLWGEKWKTWEEYEARYGLGEHPEDESKVTSMIHLFGTLGTLVREKLFDPKLLYKSYAFSTIVTWERFELLIKGWRKMLSNPHMYSSFEYLAKLFKRMQEDELTGEPPRTTTEYLEEREKVLKKHQQEVKNDD